MSESTYKLQGGRKSLQSLCEGQIIRRWRGHSCGLAVSSCRFGRGRVLIFKNNAACRHSKKTTDWLERSERSRVHARGWAGGLEREEVVKQASESAALTSPVTTSPLTLHTFQFSCSCHGSAGQCAIDSTCLYITRSHQSHTHRLVSIAFIAPAP